jgi:arylsulfatase A-like enzyme
MSAILRDSDGQRPIFAIALACIFLIAHARCARAASSPPNFLIFLADDMGYSDPGCYGGEIATPNLDALAADGIRYIQFYNTARCWPTRAALLTGYYAQQVGFDALPGFKKSDSRKRPPWARLLPEYLRPLGYRSYHSGKWHIDSSPLKCAFDHSYALLDYDHNFSPKKHTLDDKLLPPAKIGDGYYSAVAIADHAIDFLKEHDQKYRDQPFFTYVAFTVPHFPLQAPPDDIKRYAGRYNVGWDIIRHDRWQRIRKLLHLPGELSALEPTIGTPYRSEPAHRKLDGVETWNETPWNELSAEKQSYQARKMEIHAAMVTCMDRQIGRVLEQVHAMHADDNTLVLFFSDNGASAEIAMRGDGHDFNAPQGSAATFLSLGPAWANAANTPFRRHKIWVHEGGIATPLIARWPAQIKSTSQLRRAVGHVIDIAPTLVKLAGGQWPKSFGHLALPPTPGRDLAPTFSEDRAIERDCLWWLHEGNRAIRKGDWKLVAARDEQWQLYDLARDRAENIDLAASHPEKAKELDDLWQAKLAEFEKRARQDRAPDASPAIRRPAKTKN